MLDPDRQPSPPDDPTQVPDLVDAYRTRREEVRAQLRDLNRLRDEIHDAAGREAHEIVEAARREVRRTLVTARQNLLVLAAQVQAAMDRPEADGASGDPHERVVRDAARAGLWDGDRDLADAYELLVEARHSIHQIVTHARPDLDKMQDEARALRASVSPPPVVAPTSDDAARPAAPAVSEAGAAIDRLPAARTAAHTAWPRLPPVNAAAAGAAGRALADDPPASAAEPDTDPSDGTAGHATVTASAMPLRRRVGLPAWARGDVGLIPATLALIVALLAGTTWWLRAGPSEHDLESQPPVEVSAAEPAPDAPGAGSGVAGAPVEPSLSLEAYRNVWVLLTVDGEQQAGQTLRPGDGRNITGVREVVIRAGDAGALWVSVNGGPSQPMGEDGRVLTRRFSLGE